MASNKIPFDDTTNYPDVLRVTKQMFGDIEARGTKCCHPPQIEEALNKSLRWISTADSLDPLDDQERYEQAVKSAYLTIYPYSMDQDYNYIPL